jgi:hypothetical protein
MDFFVSFLVQIKHELHQALLLDKTMDVDVDLSEQCRTHLANALLLIRNVSSLEPNYNSTFFDLSKAVIEKRRDEKLENMLVQYHRARTNCSTKYEKGDLSVKAFPSTNMNRDYPGQFSTMIGTAHSHSNTSYESIFEGSLIMPDAFPHTEDTSVFGNAGALEAIKDVLLLPKMFAGHGFEGSSTIRRFPRSILLSGPPGCGKTTIIRAAAKVEDVALLPIYPSSITSKFIGDSEKFLRAAFSFAAKQTPCILFFDEIDSFCSHRGAAMGDNPHGSGVSSSRGLLSEFLILMTEVLEIYRDRQIYVFAATNRLQDLDNAIVRRFERRVVVPLPTSKDRNDMIMYYLSNINSNLSQEDYTYISRQCEGWNGSDIKLLCREAAMIPVREAACDGQSPRSDNDGGTTTLEETRLNDPFRPLERRDFHAAFRSFIPVLCESAVPKKEESMAQGDATTSSKTEKRPESEATEDPRRNVCVPSSIISSLRRD